MATVTYTVTTAQLSELKEAIAHNQGIDVSEVTNNDVKAWGLRQFQALVQKYRQSVVDVANPVSSDPIAS